MKEWTEKELIELLAQIKDAINYCYTEHHGSHIAWEKMNKSYETLETYFVKWKENSKKLWNIFNNTTE